MRLSAYSLPNIEPIHLTEAKLHLHLATDATEAALYTEKDDMLTGFIAAARQVAETETWKACCLQTWDLFLDEWPSGSEIKLPHPPLRSVEFVKYTDTDGTETTFTSYSIDTNSTPGRIVLDYGESWPTSSLRPNNPIHIRFSCGYLIKFSAATDTNLITAVNHPFSDGDKVRLSVSGGSLPAGLSLLTDYYIRDTSGDTFKFAATSGGAEINITSIGSGNLFIGVLPETTRSGMKLVLTDLFEERADTVVGRNQAALPGKLPRAATHLFAMDTAKTF